MSMLPTLAQGSADPLPRAATKPQRVLACVQCQQRKIKCDRKFPCANCIKTRAQCVSAALNPRQRRRRFPERVLLERLRRYESLLRQHNIDFEPLHSSATEKTSYKEDRGGYESPDDAHSDEEGAGASETRRKTTVKSEAVYEAKNYWNAMNDNFRDPEDDEYSNAGSDMESDGGFPHDETVREALISNIWDRLYGPKNQLLFSSNRTNVDLASLHPPQAQIFKLWQVYLDNVNPLLKVTHTPTLQARIIDAAGDMGNISPVLEALLFSIYCISIQSLLDDECQSIFRISKEDLLMNYRFGCEQALLNSGILRTKDRECLTALYLYLVSYGADIDPRSLSSMLSVAIRIAQCIGIHSDSSYAGCTVFETEMRRRLWWSLVVFDSRMCEMSDNRAPILTATWDCKTPLNVNDSDIWPDMGTPPTSHEEPTEAIFSVVRSELGDFVRHSAFYLGFNSSVAKNAPGGSVPVSNKLMALVKTIEDKYLASCNPENSIHFTTIWMARGYLAKKRLLEHYAKNSSVKQTEAQRRAAVAHALSGLECDTKLMASPLTKGYRWLIYFYFPFPSYVHIVQDLRKRPVQEYADKAWEIMSDNYLARSLDTVADDHIFFKFFSKICLQAWDAREAILRQQGKLLELPRIISDLKQRAMQSAFNAQNSDPEQANGAAGMNVDDFVDFGSQDIPWGLGDQSSTSLDAAGFDDMPGHDGLDFDVGQLDWTTLDWNSIPVRGW